MIGGMDAMVLKLSPYRDKSGKFRNM